MASVNLPDGDKWDAAEEQALAGFDMDFDGEAVDDDQPEPEAELSSDEDDYGAEDETDDALEASEDDTGEEESTAPEDGEESVAFDPQNWDGDLNSLPEETRKLIDPIYKTMERGMHKKFQELARARKEYEDKMAELVSKPTQPETAQPDGPPPAPVGTETPEQQQAMWDKRDEWFAAKALEKRAEELGLSKKDERVEQLVAEREQQKRLALVQSQEGFRPEIATAMASIAQQHPYYANLLDSDEGILVLFHTAKNALEAHELRQQSAKTKQALASKANADIKKKASAAKGAISRPGGTRKASPADTFAKTFEEAEAHALAEFESRANQ